MKICDRNISERVTRDDRDIREQILLKILKTVEDRLGKTDATILAFELGLLKQFLSGESE